MAKLTTNGRVGWRFESRLCFFAPPEGHTETQGRDYTHHTCGRRSRVRTPLNHTMCASPYKNRDLIHDLLGLSPPLPNQAPGPGTWSLLEKSSLTKSKTCIIGSKFFFFLSSPRLVHGYRCIKISTTRGLHSNPQNKSRAMFAVSSRP